MPLSLYANELEPILTNFDGFSENNHMGLYHIYKVLGSSENEDECVKFSKRPITIDVSHEYGTFSFSTLQDLLNPSDSEDSYEDECFDDVDTQFSFKEENIDDMISYFSTLASWLDYRKKYMNDEYNSDTYPTSLNFDVFSFDGHSVNLSQGVYNVNKYISDTLINVCHTEDTTSQDLMDNCMIQRIPIDRNSLNCITFSVVENVNMPEVILRQLVNSSIEERIKSTDTKIFIRNEHISDAIVFFNNLVEWLKYRKEFVKK